MSYNTDLKIADAMTARFQQAYKECRGMLLKPEEVELLHRYNWNTTETADQTKGGGDEG